MNTALRHVLHTLVFLAGLLAGMYLSAVAIQGHAQSAEVADAIHQAAATYGVSEPWLRRIAYCESRYTPWATSRGGHMGLYQYAPGTYRWMSWQAGLGGTSAYDPWAAAMVTAWALAHGYAGHWACAGAR